MHKAIVSIISILISAAGLTITIIDVVTGNNREDWVVRFLIVVSAVLLIIAAVYNIVSILHSQSRRLEYAKVKNELDIGKSANGVIFENFKSTIATYKDCRDRLQRRINIYKKDYEGIDDHAKNLLDLKNLLKLQKQNTNVDRVKVISNNVVLSDDSQRINEAQEKEASLNDSQKVKRSQVNSVSRVHSQIDNTPKNKTVSDKESHNNTAIPDSNDKNESNNSLDGTVDQSASTNNSIDFKKYIEEQRMNENIRLSNALITEYNTFMGNMLNTLRRSVEEYLVCKGCNENVSVSFKQLEKPVSYKNIDEKHCYVYTAFRDFRTYSSRKRDDTWNRRYRISKNSDFINSMEKDYFIFNFMSKKSLEDGLYQNENSSFYEYYNSGVTCAAYSSIDGERKLFGYLSCDALFDNHIKSQLGEDIFDWNVANIVMHSAQIIAMYLDSFLAYWDWYYQNFDKTVPFNKIEINKWSSADNKKIKYIDGVCVVDTEVETGYNEAEDTFRLERRDFCYIIRKRVAESRYDG